MKHFKNYPHKMSHNHQEYIKRPGAVGSQGGGGKLKCLSKKYVGGDTATISHQ